MCIVNACRLWSLDYNTKIGLLHSHEQLLTQIAAAYPGHLTRSPQSQLSTDSPSSVTGLQQQSTDAVVTNLQWHRVANQRMGKLRGGHSKSQSGRGNGKS